MIARDLQVISAWSDEFKRGLAEGIANSQEHPRWNLTGPIGEEELTYIVTNLIALAQENKLSDGILQRDLGAIAGWFLRPD